jgi:hypothetical protein
LFATILTVGAVKKTDDAANERTPLKTAKVGGRQRLKPDRVPSFALRASYPHRYYARHEPTLEEYNTTTHSDSLNRFLFRMATRWSLIKSFLSLITVGGLFTILLAVLSTLLCYHYNFKASLPLAFLGTGIFFPISFGISWAFRRREQALLDMADLKSAAVALYQCHREWDAEEAQHQAKSRGKKKNLTQEEQSVQEMLKDSKTDQRYAADLLTESGQFHQSLVASRGHFQEDGVYVGYDDHGKMALEMRKLLIDLFEEINIFLRHYGGPDSLTKIYFLFDQIWKQQEELRHRNEWVASLLSRALQ